MSHLPVETKSFEIALGEGLFIRGETKSLVDGIAKPVLLISHGFKGFKDWGFFPYISDWFAARGLFTVSFNFSRNGVKETDFDELDKFADNSYAQDQMDLEALYGEILEGKLPLAEHADPQRIFLLGHSRGGFNSLLFALGHPEISGIVTWNGSVFPNLFDDFFESEVRKNGVAYIENARTKQQMPIKMTFFDDLERNRERYDLVARFHLLTAPALILQGDQDFKRLLLGASKLREAAPNQTHMTLPGGNHTFGAVHPFVGTTRPLEAALDVSFDFLGRLLSDYLDKRKC